MVCNRILYTIDLACPEMTKITQFVMTKLFKITHNLLCEKCRKSRYFCGRILTRIYARGRFMKYSMYEQAILLKPDITRKLQHATISYIWNLKDNNINYNIKWKTVDRAPKLTEHPNTKKCWLCIK